ncbi:Polyadenylate-binding protein 2 [Rhynchospora pubera]|uniref:Polyadenylate-binding protein 2 n=1 Tax=Rhynchospora pubera TaxID=906938 RepID=A0AAV8HME5_9POAL|nr:Polyadenylate-binding protein 2 [Rhynchospora pubera]
MQEPPGNRPEQESQEREREREREMAEMVGAGGDESEVFKSEPVSYRVDRRSALKMELRPALSEKFAQFFGTATHETLVEYVVVLLCTGKNQYQARKILAEFLGDNTDSFVAWLWDYLSRRGDAMDKSGHISSNCKRLKVQRASSEVATHAGNTSLDKERLGGQSFYVGSRVHSENPVLSSRRLPEEIHGGVTHEVLLAPENNLHGSVTPPGSLQKRLGASVTKKRIVEEPPFSSPRKVNNSGTVDDSGSYLPCPEESQHYKRVENAHASTRFSRSFRGPKSEIVVIGRSTKLSNREKHRTEQSKNLTKLAIEKELKPVRRNVWDRLSKPQNETNNPFLRERNNSFIEIPTATTIHPLVTQNISSTLPYLPCPHTQAHFVSTSLYPNGVVRPTPVCNPMRVSGEIVNKLKRQFEQIESTLQESAIASKSGGRVPAKHRLGSSVGAPQPLPVGNCFSSNIVNDSVIVETGLESEIVCNAEPENNEQRPPNTLKKEKTLENSKSGNSSQEPPSKVPALKLKVEEMENDMQEVLSKHAQVENLKPDSETNSSSGAQPSQMEDMDSRTILVTNVHFGATKEAIVSHFAQCGPVTKVIMLRDTITGKPKGIACVIFTKKDSIEKAVSLSGSSFLSRTLKVMRKAEAPAALSEEPHQVWKQSHSLQFPPPSWNSLQRYPLVTHHQWRRENNPSVPT